MAGCSSAVVGRVVAVGEMLGTTFAFTGEGIGGAMRSASLAAEVIDLALRADNPSLLTEIDQVFDRRLKPAFAGYDVAQRWLSRPWLNDFVARRVRRSPLLQERASRFMAAAGDPRGLFSFGSLLRSFWS
jgi:flavin-dependent dehydrogenase